MDGIMLQICCLLINRLGLVYLTLLETFTLPQVWKLPHNFTSFCKAFYVVTINMLKQMITIRSKSQGEYFWLENPMLDDGSRSFTHIYQK